MLVALVTGLGGAVAACGDDGGGAPTEVPATQEAALAEAAPPGSKVLSMGFAGDDGLGASAVGPEAPEVTFLDAVPESVLELVALSRGGDEVVDLPVTPSAQEELMALVASTKEDDTLRVVVALPDPAFDFEAMAAAEEMERAALIEQRREQLAAAQAVVRVKLTALGATDIAEQWIVNQLVATVQAADVKTVAGWEEVHEVSLAGTGGGSGLAYGGQEARDGMRTQSFISAGFEGNTGGRRGGRVKIGIIEWHDDDGTTNWIARSHIGWRESDVDATSRLIRQYDCRSGTCTVSLNSPAVGTHGTAVAWVAGGSIEQGQDSNFAAGSLDSLRRSGQASETLLYYYMIDGCTEFNAALQRALDDEVDIVNFSAWLSRSANKPNCRTEARTYDCNGVNAAIRNATDAGVLVLACAGNDGHPPPDCTMWYPGFRTDTFAVNGLMTTEWNMVYQFLTLLGDASVGGVPLRRLGGGISLFAGVDMSAPGAYNYNFTTALRSYNTGDLIRGCSYATPAMTGAAALMREMLAFIGWDPNNARMLFTQLLLQGDTWDFDTATHMRTEVSDWSGFGRIRMHYPSDADLVAPWGWGYVFADLTGHQPSLIRQVGGPGPESPSITQWKWVVTWFEDDMTEVSDIVIEVWDVCPPGGGEVQIAADHSTDLRKRIHLQQAEIAGRCLETRIHGLTLPLDGKRIYTADYFHSGDPAWH